MTTRRNLCLTVFGMLAAIPASRGLLAQQTDQDDQDSLQPRGAPTGRIGAATRGMYPGAQGVTLDLVAPSRGVGLTSFDRPTLCYLLSGVTSAPLQLTISTRGQARPLVDLELPRPVTRLGVVDLREHDARLAAGLVYVWSVALRLDPKAPSHDLVASALIQYKPVGPALEKEVRDAPAEQQPAMFEQNGYWYDAVTLAVRNAPRDNGSVLTALLRKAGLQAETSAGGQTP